MKKITFIVTLCMCLITVPAVTAYAATEDELKTRVEDSYANGLQDAGVTTFNNYCTRATARQMDQVGLIDYDDLDERPSGNGNTWYDFYADREGETTSKGYTIVCREGGDGLDELLEEYGQPLYNIVVSYGTGGKNGSNHVMFIHAIVDDIVYFTDNYRYTLPDGTRISEGQAWPSISVKQYIKYYKKMYGEALGAVYFQPSQLYDEKWVWDTDSSFWKYRLSDGSFAKGWKTIDDKQYYFKNDSSLTHSQFYQIDGNWYLFNTDGIMQTGWKNIDDNWYYMDDFGRRQENTFIEKNGYTYYLGSNGAMVRAACLFIDGVEYDVSRAGVVTQKSGEKSTISKLKITGATKPDIVILGRFFAIDGTITSENGNIITKVYAAIWDQAGNPVQEITVYPNASSYRLNMEVDNALIFNTLKIGNYRYILNASDSLGNEQNLIDKSFQVVKK